MNRTYSFVLQTLTMALLVAAVPLLSRAAKVTSIDFQSSDDSSEIQIHSDGPISYDKQDNPNDKQIVLNLKNATLTKNASRNFDTSSFDSKVLLISPYAVEGQSNTSRVVIQLRDMESASVSQTGNVIKISVPNSGSYTPDNNAAQAAGAAQAPSAATDAPPSTTPQPNIPPSTDAVATPPATAANAQPTDAATPTFEIKDKLQQFIEARETRRFTGSPINLKVRDADLPDVFRLIAEASGFNIVLGEDVKGKITMSVEGVPWDQALDVILHTQKLGAERNNNLLRIVTLASLTQEKQAELQARIATEASAPRVTRVFPVSYAKLEDLVTVLNKFSSATTAGSGTPTTPGVITVTSSAAAAIIQADSRTNSIVVRAIPEDIERIQKLIEILDTQTHQVLIESKIVEATEQFSKTIGGSLGFGNGSSNTQFFSSFAGADPIDPLFSNGTVTPIFTTGASASGTGSSSSGGGSGSSGSASPGGSFGMSPQLAFLPSSIRLNALLSLAETEESIKVVSAPRTVVLDKESASIVQSTPVLVPALTSTQNGPVSTSTIAQANLSLNVVPTITNEGSVVMQLNVSNDVPFSLGGSQEAVANRNISTRVLVESGSTLVMGGIYTVNRQHSASGFPFLRNIPIIGALFGTDQDSDARTELFFFITPRILNLKESGLSQS